MTKKLTAKELDAQIGFGKEIDVDAVVAKMKKPTKVKATKKAIKTDTEIMTERATKIAEQVKVKEPKETVTKVLVKPSRDNTSFEVWVAYKREGYIRGTWKSQSAVSIKEALELAEKYIAQIGLSNAKVTA